MKKLSILVFLVSFFSSVLIAQKTEAGGALTQYNQIFITLHDGSRFAIPIDTISQIKSITTAEGIQKVLVYGKEKNYEFFRKEIRLLTFQGGEASVIQTVSADDSHEIGMNKEGDQIIFARSLKGSVVTFTDISGRIICKTTVPDDCHLRLEFLPRGFYIISAGKYNLKMLKE